MDRIILQIESVISHLMKSEYDEYADGVSNLINSMIQIFPTIIACYYNPLMNEYVSDATYWPSQLERIMNAVKAEDELAVIDVLYNETYQNLIELKNILQQKGIGL